MARFPWERSAPHRADGKTFLFLRILGAIVPSRSPFDFVSNRII
jgi:hypothetical protein